MVPEFEVLRGFVSGNQAATIYDVELMRLAWLGAQVPDGGAVVELGSYRGKSTCAIGCGVRAAGRTGVTLFAVDLWLKGKGKTFDHYTTEETWRVFNAQVTSVGLGEMVRPVMRSTRDAALKRSKPVDFLFVDANHSFGKVLEDFEMWERFVPRGGWIAFHDYGSKFEGVDRVVNKYVAPSGDWSKGEVHGRIWSARRLRF
jgi:hypothetical protein